MQLTLKYLTSLNYQVDDFIVSSCNEFAYDVIMRLQNDKIGSLYPNTILLYGPHSSGKTHLSRIWQSKTGAYHINTSQAEGADILGHYSHFIIDQIEDFHDHKLLLYWFNIINEYNKKLMLISNNEFLDSTLPDLSSRLKSIFKIQIHQPDDNLMKVLLFKNFSNLSILVPNNVIDFIVKILPRQFDRINLIVDALNELALMHNKKISIKLVKEFLTSNSANDLCCI